MNNTNKTPNQNILNNYFKIDEYVNCGYKICDMDTLSNDTSNENTSDENTSDKVIYEFDGDIHTDIKYGNFLECYFSDKSTDVSEEDTSEGVERTDFYNSNTSSDEI